MKNKKGFVALLAAFVLLLAGAMILYQFLAKNQQPDMLGTVEEGAVEETDAGENAQAGQQTASGEETEDTAQGSGVAAPDFTVLDAQGNEVKLSDFQGKPVVLNFWASWCGPCKSEMPDFDAAYAEYGEEVQFMMINLTDGSRETLETAAEFVEEQGYSFPVYYDTESQGAIAYGVMAIPTTYFIDAQGNAVARAMSALDRETLEQGIGMILESVSD